MDNNQNQIINDAHQSKCSACGGVMQYAPREGNLKCLYCGHTQNIERGNVEIEENDFLYWSSQAESATDSADSFETASDVKCRQCGATTTLPPNTSGAKCAFCSTPLILQEASVQRFWKPDYMIPFVIADKEAATKFHSWLGRRWFLPNKVKRAGVRTEAFKGVYMPFWTFDAEAHSLYQGERGDDHTEVRKGANGKQERVTVTTWTQVSGHVNNSFDDVIVPASTTLPNYIASSLDNWALEQCVPYRHEYVAGYVTEIYSKDFRACYPIAQKKMEVQIRSSVENAIGGDRQRVHNIRTEYDEIMFKLLLLPIWISSFSYNGKLYQFVVNGQTGQVSGNYPRSTVKIIIFVLCIALILGLMYWFTQS